MIRRLFDHWDNWACREAPPHALALLRIGLGAFLLLYWGLKLPHVSVLFSDRGLQLPLFTASSPQILQWLSQAPPPLVAWALYLTLLACLLCVTVGFSMRVTGLVAVALYAYYWGLTLHLFPTSYDRLLPVALLVVTLSGADRALSVRAWQRLGSPLCWEPCSVLPQRILALQVAATYLGVGWQKMVLPAWQSAEILTDSFAGIWGTPFGFWLLRRNLPMGFYDAALHSVMALEFFIPFGLFIPRVQWYFFVGGALFHIGVTLLLGIWWFLVLIPAYVVFLEPESVHRWLHGQWPSVRLESGRSPGPARPRHLHLGRHVSET